MTFFIAVKRETDSLPDLEDNIDEGNEFESNENFDNDLAMAQYQGEDSQPQENADIINTLIINQGGEEEGGTEGDSYITGDMEGQPEQQFLTISQGNSQITVNDSGSIVYTDASFIDNMDQFAQKDDGEVENSEENTLYYQASGEGIEEHYLQEESEMIHQEEEEESASTALVFTQDDAATPQVVSESILHHVNQTSGPITINTGATLVSRADLRNFVTIQPEPRPVKRSIQPGPSKNVIAKVFVQNTSKGPVAQKAVTSSMGGRRMSLAQAQRMGLISPKLQQVLSSSPGTSGRMLVKKVIPTSGSSLLVKSPTKILPAPAPRERITLTQRNTLPVGHAVRTSIPISQLKTFLTSTTAQTRPVTVTKSVGSTITRVDSRSPQKVVIRPVNASGQLRIPVHIGGKQQVQYVKLVNAPTSSGISLSTLKQKVVQTSVARSIAPTPVRPAISDSNAPKRIFLNVAGSDKMPATFHIQSTDGRARVYTTVKSSAQASNNEKSVVDVPEESTEDSGKMPDSEEVAKANEDEEDEVTEANPDSPQRLLEANGIRPKKPCNCTRSQCLKLYCECFANGEFCFQCNCNNCYNNIEHEEERQLSIKSCLERNPSAFRPKIHMADSDEEERHHNKGCNCKRSHCLKNYCECFEAKLHCGKYCKCLSCKNTEEEMGSWVRYEGAESADEEKESPVKGTPFINQTLAEALCQCILAQARAAEQDGEDVVTTEQRIIEELGQRLVQIIGNRRKGDSR